jgi:hypothetical protein
MSNTNTNTIQWPEWATHARQEISDSASVIRKANMDIIQPGVGSLRFGEYLNFTFVGKGETFKGLDIKMAKTEKKAKRKIAKKVASKRFVSVVNPVVDQETQSVFFDTDGTPTVHGVRVEWFGRRREIVRQIFLGRLNAREIAAMIMEIYGPTEPALTLEKAYAHTRATVAHLRQQLGIIASFRKANGTWTEPRLVGVQF